MHRPSDKIYINSAEFLRVDMTKGGQIPLMPQQSGRPKSNPKE
jgi:hypothetical protein